MRQAVALALAACAALACGARLSTDPLAPVEGRFQGDVQARVGLFNQALQQCGERRAETARQYNTVRARSDHWDFWTVTLGLMSDAVAAGIALADSGNPAPRTIIGISGIAVGLSQAVKAASRVENDANRKYEDYAYWNARVVAARTDLQRIQPVLESGDPPLGALAALDSLTASVIRGCNESPPLR